MNPKQFQLPKDFAGDVRLFPLPELVMFPRNVQPLHIFEPRYCEMLQQALAGDRLIAMATLQCCPVPQLCGRVPISDAVCIGEVAMHKRRADGTHSIALVGVSRAQIIKELDPVFSFREAQVRILNEHSADDDSDGEDCSGQELARFLSKLVPATSKLSRDYMDRRIDLATYTDIVAFRLPLEKKLKLNLLSEPDPCRRANLILRSLCDSALGSTSSSRFPPVFSQN